MIVPFEGAYCSLALRSWGGLPIIIDPNADRGLPQPLAFADADWQVLAEIYRRA